MTREQQALKIYDLLREAHKRIQLIYREVTFEDRDWENAVDAVDSTLYLAEGFFTREATEIAPRKTPSPKLASTATQKG